MSYGQQLLKRHLSLVIRETPLEDYRPAWLEGLELDFFYPDHGLAFEFNGDQHYCPTRLGDVIAQRKRDARKRAICKQVGVKLITLTAADLLLSRIRMKVKNADKCRLLPYAPAPALDADSAGYRKTLIARFDSPTARRKGKAPWKASMTKAWAKRGNAN